MASYYKNPVNGYTEKVSMPALWVLLLGFIYFAGKGIWRHFLISLILAPFTYGASWILYPLFASSIVKNSYLRKGWEEIPESEVKKASLANEFLDTLYGFIILGWLGLVIYLVVNFSLSWWLGGIIAFLPVIFYIFKPSGEEETLGESFGTGLMFLVCIGVFIFTVVGFVNALMYDWDFLLALIAGATAFCVGFLGLMIAITSIGFSSEENTSLRMYGFNLIIVLLFLSSTYFAYNYGLYGVNPFGDQIIPEVNLRFTWWKTLLIWISPGLICYPLTIVGGILLSDDEDYSIMLEEGKSKALSSDRRQEILEEVEPYKAEISLLIAIGRGDKRLIKAERELITQYCLKDCKLKASEVEMHETIKTWKVSQKQFKNSLEEISLGKRKNNFLKSLENLLGHDKSQEKYTFKLAERIKSAV